MAVSIDVSYRLASTYFITSFPTFFMTSALFAIIIMGHFFVIAIQFQLLFTCYHHNSIVLMVTSIVFIEHNYYYFCCYYHYVIIIIVSSINRGSIINSLVVVVFIVVVVSTAVGLAVALAMEVPEVV